MTMHIRIINDGQNEEEYSCKVTSLDQIEDRELPVGSLILKPGNVSNPIAIYPGHCVKIEESIEE